VKIESLSFKVGDHIDTDSNPVILTYLGDQLSAETSKERKHLHFGIYKGTDLYFVGHESSLTKLEKRWLNPNTFLKEQKAVDPVAKPTSVPTITPVKTVNNAEEKISFIQTLLDWLKQILVR